MSDIYYGKLEKAFQTMLETPVTTKDKINFLDNLIGKPNLDAKRDCITPVREKIITALNKVFPEARR